MENICDPALYINYNSEFTQKILKKLIELFDVGIFDAFWIFLIKKIVLLTFMSILIKGLIYFYVLFDIEILVINIQDR